MKGFSVAIGLLCAACGVTHAQDTLLQQALDRPTASIADMPGHVQTAIIVNGQRDPDVDSEVVAAGKSSGEFVTSYAELKKVIGEDAQLTAQQPGRSIYAFTTRRFPSGGSGEVHISADGSDPDASFQGQAVVSRDAQGHPYISHLDLHMPHGDGNLIARINRIDLSYTYAPSAKTGAMQTTSVAAHVDVRALLFVHKDVLAQSVYLADNGSP